MRGPRLSAFLFVLLLLAPSVIADFTVDIEPAQQVIKLNETAEFALTISHNSKKTEYFNFYSPDVLWDLSTVPASDRTLTVPKGAEKTTKLLVRPLYVQPGFYGVALRVNMAGTNQTKEHDLRIGVTRETFGQYMPAIRPALRMPDRVNPLEEVTIKVRLENQNRRNIEKLDLKLRSKLINKDYTTALKPLESKEVEFKARLDPATPPQTDNLKVTVFTNVGNRTVRFDLPAHKYTVLGYGEVVESRVVETGFLATTTKITLKNDGNTVKEQMVEFQTDPFSRWFSSANFDYAVTKNEEGRHLTWKMRLDAMEEQTITVTVNYRPVLYFLILLGIVLGLYYTFRSPLVVKKGAMVVHSKHGEVSELKVFITMRNRSRNSLHELVILDMVPPFASVKQEFEVGTLNPDKVVRNEKKGTQLKWIVDVLEPKEERIMSYKIKTKLSILGGFRLPPAQVKYKFFNYERLKFSSVQNLFNR